MNGHQRADNRKYDDRKIRQNGKVFENFPILSYFGQVEKLEPITMRLERAPGFTAEFFNKYTELYTSEHLQPLFHELYEQYDYWDKVKYKAVQGLTPEEAWMMTKMRRINNFHRLTFGNHHFGWNINRRIQGYLHFLDMNIGGSLESTTVIDREDRNRYLLSSIMEEAIASSQIEGAITTRKQAKEMLRRNRRPKNKSEQMVYNNYITIQKILDIRSDALDKKNLLAIHKLVTTDTMPLRSEEGAFRTGNNIDVIDSSTDEVVHHPPDVGEIESMLEDLYRFFNDENDGENFIHPLIKGSIIHFMIGYIHPFADGNGRTARALFYWYLLKKGYWLTEYLSISRLIFRAKAQYGRAFIYTETDDHDLTYFILFNLRTIKLSFQELRQYIQRKNEEKIKLSDFLKLGGVSYKQATILEWFYKEPNLLLTSKETESRLGVSKVGARNNLMQLVEKGYLMLIDLDKKTNGFAKSVKFDALIAGAKPNAASSNDADPIQNRLF